MKPESATQFLRNDHKNIRGLLTQAQSSELRAPEMREGVLRELSMMLEVHAQLEEEIFYPALEKESALTSLLVNGRDDLASIKQRLSQINGDDEALQEISDLAFLHMETEERDLFPEAEKILKQSSLSEQMSFRKRELMQDHRYQQARPENVQNPKGGEQMRKVAG